MFTTWWNKTGSLCRFIFRRDRIRIPVWLIALTLTTVGTAAAFVDIYSTEAERQAAAEVMLNPAMTALVGPGYGMDDYTLGAMFAHQMFVLTAVVVAIMNILLIVRHTRADEEDGQIELIRSLPTGRLSNVSAALIVMLVVNVLLAVLHAAGLAMLNMESMDVHGSVLYGVALGACGFFFAAVTAFVAQLSEYARGTIGLGFAMLIGSYMIRAIGDVSNETLSLLSPFGWVHRTEVFVRNEWWPIVLMLGGSVVFVLLALYVNMRRDVGAGLLPSKPGREYASSLLTRPFGLTLRLQRIFLVAWAIGMFVFGASYGSVLGDAEVYLEDLEIMEGFLAPVAGFSLTDQFVAMIMSVIAIVCTIPPLMVVLRIKGEENKNRIEHLLSRVVSRNRLFASYTVLGICTGIVMVVMAGLGMGVAALAAVNEGVELGMFIQAALVYVPAMSIMVGLALLLVGRLPRLSGIVWLYIIYSFLMVYLGGLLQMPEWTEKLSPFGNTPQVPIDEVSAMPLITMSAIALILIIVGFVGYNKRDIHG